MPLPPPLFLRMKFQLAWMKAEPTTSKSARVVMRGAILQATHPMTPPGGSLPGAATSADEPASYFVLTETSHSPFSQRPASRGVLATEAAAMRVGAPFDLHASRE